MAINHLLAKVVVSLPNASKTTCKVIFRHRILFYLACELLLLIEMPPLMKRF